MLEGTSEVSSSSDLENSSRSESLSLKSEKSESLSSDSHPSSVTSSDSSVGFDLLLTSVFLGFLAGLNNLSPSSDGISSLNNRSSVGFSVDNPSGRSSISFDDIGPLDASILSVNRSPSETSLVLTSLDAELLMSIDGISGTLSSLLGLSDLDNLSVGNLDLVTVISDNDLSLFSDLNGWSLGDNDLGSCLHNSVNGLVVSGNLTNSLSGRGAGSGSDLMELSQIVSQILMSKLDRSLGFDMD